MADQGVRPALNEFVMLLDGDKTAPVASDPEPGPDGETDAQGGKHQAKPFQHQRALREKAAAQPMWPKVVGKEQKECRGDRNELKDPRTRRLRALCPLGGQRADEPEN